MSSASSQYLGSFFTSVTLQTPMRECNTKSRRVTRALSSTISSILDQSRSPSPALQGPVSFYEIWEVALGITAKPARRRHADLSSSISTKGPIMTKKQQHRPSPRLPENFLKGRKKKKPHASKLEWFAVLSAALTVLKWGRKGFLYVPSLSSPQGLKAREISVLHSSHPSASNAHCSYLTDSQKGTKCKKHYEFELSLLKLPLCY